MGVSLGMPGPEETIDMQETRIKLAAKIEFNKDLTDLQARAVRTLVFESQRSRRSLKLIAKTASGKSLVLYTASLFFRGITVLVAPLVALGVDQAEKINDPCRTFSTVQAVNADMFKGADLAKCVHDMKQITRDRLMADSCILIISPGSLAKPEWQGVLEHHTKERNIRLVVFDEAHMFATDGLTFRQDLVVGAKYLVSTIRKNQRDNRCAFLAMSATFPQAMQLLTERLLGLQFYHTIWTDMARRDIEITVIPCDQSIGEIKKLVGPYVKKEHLFMVSSTSAARANAFAEHLGEHLKEIGDVATLEGGTGSLMKQYLMSLFSKAVTNSEFNLLGLCVTLAANCGVSSNYLRLCICDGPIQSLINLAQYMGRLGRARRLEPLPDKFAMILTITSIESFIKTVASDKDPIKEKTSSTVKKNSIDDVRQVLLLMALPKECYHVAMERAFEDPQNGQDRSPCDTKCPYCTGDYKTFTGPVCRTQIVRRLQSLLNGQPQTLSQIQKHLSKNQNKEAIWPTQAKSNVSPGNVGMLVIGLFASGIIDIDLHTLKYKWATNPDNHSHIFKYENDECWDRFHLITSA